MTLYTQNPEIKMYLEKSLASAKQINPSTHLNPAQDLNSYLDFIDSASKLAPQEILNNPSDLIRDQILQSICYFYFLVDQPIPELDGRGYYKNAIQYHPSFANWLRKFATTWGNYLDTTASWSQEQYMQFYNDPNFRLATGDYESSSNWNTFNRFFSRYLASPSKRPIASPGDDSIVVSPADSEPQGVWGIDAYGNIKVDGNKGLRIKNTRYFNVNDLLGPKTRVKYANAFNGGTLSHTFLNVFDYHRYHFPVGGLIKTKPEVVQQNVSLEVTWDPSTQKYAPIDSTGWQFTQTRGVVVVETKYGPVALIPMGMAHVSSVNFESNVKQGYYRQKGDMLGTFLFGGSDYIMLFPKTAHFKITAPSNWKNEFQHRLMGESYGKMSYN